MPTCLKQAGLSTGGSVPVYVGNVGNNGIASPQRLPVFLEPDNATTDISNCAAVSISGAEYLALTAGSGSSSTPSGSPTVDVTADIFVGAVLVVCFAVGWIAGAQR